MDYSQQVGSTQSLNWTVAKASGDSGARKTCLASIYLPLLPPQSLQDSLRSLGPQPPGKLRIQPPAANPQEFRCETQPSSKLREAELPIHSQSVQDVEGTGKGEFAQRRVAAGRTGLSAFCQECLGLHPAAPITPALSSFTVPAPKHRPHLMLSICLLCSVGARGTYASTAHVGHFWEQRQSLLKGKSGPSS